MAERLCDFMHKQFRVLDLFSGAGGFSCGLEMANGFSTAVATDFDQQALNTFQHNFPNAKCVLGNICESETKQQIVALARKCGVNMVVGGPPCQGFSLKGKKLGLDDPRNFLFLEYVDIVHAIRPDVFIIENVKNLTTACHGFFIQQIQERFSQLGYHISHGVLCAYDFGVPQMRERTIIIGTLDHLITLPTYNHSPRHTVRDAISDLAYLESGEGSNVSDYRNAAESDLQRLLRGCSAKLYNHKATRHSEFALQKLSMIPSEGDKRSMPSELYGKQQFATTWARLVWDKPSPTIDTRFDTPSNGRNSHPFLNRAITPREAARLQSFPDSFVFYGNKCAICRQIGNAVPPLLAKAIGNHIQHSFLAK